MGLVVAAGAEFPAALRDESPAVLCPANAAVRGAGGGTGGGARPVALHRLHGQPARQRHHPRHPAGRHRLYFPPGAAARPGDRLDRKLSPREAGERSSRWRRRRAPRLLASMARMLGARRDGRVSLSATSLQTLLDGIGSRLSETRETSRYLIGVLIFLGLLGTFYGLLETVRSVGGVIGGLNVGGERSRACLRQSEIRVAIAARRHGDRVQLVVVRARRQPRSGLSRSAGRTGAEPLLQRSRRVAVDLHEAVGRRFGRGRRRVGSRPTSRPCSSRPPTAWKTCSGSWRAARRAGSAPTRPWRA